MRVLFLFLLLSGTAFGQVPNAQFEEWVILFGKEVPAHWDCPKLCPNASCGPCDKVQTDPDNLAVRIRNTMPCATAMGKDQIRGMGLIETFFVPPGEDFRISFDLTIDSVDAPAEFFFTIRGKNSGFGWKTFAVYQTDSLQSGRIGMDIHLDMPYDSLYILFRSKGLLKPGATNPCELGYISGVVDDIRTEKILGLEDLFGSEISLFPNPFQDHFYLKGEHLLQGWEMYNPLGAMVRTGTGERVDGLEGLPPGLYLLRIQTDRGLLVRKIRKEY